MATARQTALKILYSIEFEGAYSNLAIKSGLENSGLDLRDRGLTTQLVYGTISRKRALDAVITKYSSVKLSKLSKYVLLILRLGIYQLLFTDKIPPSAAVNESVKLAEKFARRSKGFINGVLRSVERGGYNFKSIAEELSYPDWLYEMWCLDYGEDKAKSIMRSLNESPKMTIRANYLKTDRASLIKELIAENISAEPDTLYERSIKVSGLDVSNSKAFGDGLFTVQDTAASLSVAVLNPKPGDICLDLCAAPGGKTTLMAELMKNQGSILAFDIHEHKISLIEVAARRLGIDIINAECGDATEENKELFEKFDCVLADVPCSGLGIIRRKPEIKYTSAPNEDLYSIQKKILDNAGKYLKPGGVLVYSTCTLNKFENELRIKSFLEENRNFESVSISEYFKSKTSEQGFVQINPDEYDCDGFFIAKLRKIIM